MNKTEIATVGGGCFWCIEAVYQRIDGIKSVTPGYAGGKSKTTTYKEVCKGTTGHAEVCLLYTSPSPRDKRQSRMPSSA